MIKTFEHRGEDGDDYFCIIKSRSSNKSLEYYLNKFNIDNYHIIKKSYSFRFINKEDFLNEFKYSGYMFYKKEIYSKEFIEEWFLYLNDNYIMISYLSKPFPPSYIKDMIKIIDII